MKIGGTKRRWYEKLGIPTCKLYKLYSVIILNVLIVFNVISCRRTGVPLNIKARKDSHGFENIDDYFPDSGRVIM